MGKDIQDVVRDPKYFQKIQLLNSYAAVAMRLQEEYLKPEQDFALEKQLQKEFSALTDRILLLMGD